jgi:hypothetical protein
MWYFCYQKNVMELYQKKCEGPIKTKIISLRFWVNMFIIITSSIIRDNFSNIELFVVSWFVGLFRCKHGSLGCWYFIQLRQNDYSGWWWVCYWIVRWCASMLWLFYHLPFLIFFMNILILTILFPSKTVMWCKSVLGALHF